MKIHAITGVASIALLGLSGSILAQEQGRVISTTPVISQVAVPRQVCSNEQVVSQVQQRSGAGAVIGGVAGAVVGNAVGRGHGRAAATVLGAFGGAILGDSIEGSNQQASKQNVQRCTTQTFYENKATAYNVVYEFNGKQYQVQLPQDPGPFVSLQITPVGSATQSAPTVPAPVIVQPVAQTPIYSQPVVIESSTVYVQQPQVIYVHPAPVYHVAPNYPPNYHHDPRPHAHSHLHPHLQPQHLAYAQRPNHQPHQPQHRPGSVISIGHGGHFR